MKINIGVNPMPIKTYNPNWEPWLTYRELIAEGLAVWIGNNRENSK